MTVFARLLITLFILICSPHIVMAQTSANDGPSDGPSEGSGESSLIAPSPNLSPEDVVEIQLLGLKLTKGDSSSLEMRQVWAFAHPANKAMTGPLARFATLFDMPAYRPLLGHVSHQIIRLSLSEDYAQLQVQITGTDSRSYVYLWVVARASSGPEAGSWMTMSVSAPAGGGTQS